MSTTTPKADIKNKTNRNEAKTRLVAAVAVAVVVKVFALLCLILVHVLSVLLSLFSSLTLHPSFSVESSLLI